MFGSSGRIASRRWFRLGLGIAASVIALSAQNASARVYGHHHHRAAVASQAGGPPFAAIVVDENTGREIYGVNENALRHPASITKVMTLYLLFEQLDKGNMSLGTQIPISQHAASQQPSKLGIGVGDSLSVEDAIKAVVTRSANDVAVAIAESIGGDESSFAEMMTRKAHALGMSRTLYRNASGLPNDEQWTTAHDLTVLARSLEERFPQYFHYFSTHEFNYDGEIIGNHNHLLGRIDGVDGIKTGYTNASGFNLLTSVHRDGRSLVAVVMGGRTAAARDITMENLITTHIAEASNHGHTAERIADNESPVARPALANRAEAAPAVATPHAELVKASNESGEGDEDERTAPAKIKTPPAPKKIAEAAKTEKPAATVADAASHGWKKGPDAAPAKEQTRVARNDGDAPTAKPTGWIVQVGLGDSAGEAHALLDKAKGRARMLADARGYTEKFSKDGDVYYRARFSGLDGGAASNACRKLRRSGFSCFATAVD